MHHSSVTFDWEDAFELEGQLTTEERLIGDAARAYAQEKLLPRITAAFDREHTDWRIFPEMGALGLLGVTAPEEHGG